MKINGQINKTKYTDIFFFISQSPHPHHFFSEFLVKRTDSSSKLLITDSSNSDQQKSKEDSLISIPSLKQTDFHPKKISDFGKLKKNESIISNCSTNFVSLSTPPKNSSKKHILGLREQVIKRNMLNNEEEGNKISY